MEYTKEEKEEKNWGILRQDTIKSWRVGLTYAEAKKIKDDCEQTRLEAIGRGNNPFWWVVIIKVVE